MRLLRQVLVQLLATSWRCYDEDTTWRKCGRHTAVMFYANLSSAILWRLAELAPALTASLLKTARRSISTVLIDFYRAQTQKRC